MNKEKKGLKVAFGLKAQGHIPTIESELKRWNKNNSGVDMTYCKAAWEGIGKKIGWCPFTAALSYLKHINKEANERKKPINNKEFLEAHEELETMIIEKDSFWCPNPCVHMDSNKIRDKFMEVQKMRNELKAELGDNSKKPLSELTEEDAIKIAEVAINFEGWEVLRMEEGSISLVCCFDSFEHRMIISDSFNFYAFSKDGAYSHPISVNASAATDKARELGYNV